MAGGPQAGKLISFCFSHFFLDKGYILTHIGIEMKTKKTS